MDCKRTRDLIPELVDGRLAGADVAPVRQHLAYCAECRKEHDIQAGTWKLLLEHKPVKADLLPGLRRRLKAARIVRLVAPLAAAAAVLLVVVSLLLSPPTGGGDRELQAEIEKLSAEDQALLFDLARPGNRELAEEDIELLGALEVVGAEHVSRNRDLIEPH